MKKPLVIFLLPFLMLCLLGLNSCAHQQSADSPLAKLGRDHEREPVDLPDFKDMLSASWRWLTVSQTQQSPEKPMPVVKQTIDSLAAIPDNGLSAVRLGHSTVLLKVGSEYWLTDPIFSDSLGPVYAMGIPRYHPSPISVEDLPPIRGVLISHNHYDHLDEKSIRAIDDKVERYFVPNGNGPLLVDWGVAAEKIIELDWWESTSSGDHEVIAAPANHMSGRGVFDQNEALWGSWILSGPEYRVFFSGDSGYSSIFKEIGQRYGPFDLTLMENGAYDRAWRREHLFPDETVQAHLDVGGRYLMPIHNSSFDLAFHSWNEPLEKVSAIAKEQGVAILTPRIGEAVTIEKAQTNASFFGTNWWRE